MNDVKHFACWFSHTYTVFYFAFPLKPKSKPTKKQLCIPKCKWELKRVFDKMTACSAFATVLKKSENWIAFGVAPQNSLWRCFQLQTWNSSSPFNVKTHYTQHVLSWVFGFSGFGVILIAYRGCWNFLQPR